MKWENETYREFYEELVQNAKKGSVYNVKLFDDNTLYRAMPYIEKGVFSDADTVVTMKILAPEDQKGVQQVDLEKIEQLENLS